MYNIAVIVVFGVVESPSASGDGCLSLHVCKVGQPRMEEVEVKGKKQMMFLGMPTYEGSLRFADVSHLQSVRKKWFLKSGSSRQSFFFLPYFVCVNSNTSKTLSAQSLNLLPESAA